MRTLIILGIILFFFSNTFSQIIPDDYNLYEGGHIPPESRINWHSAGLLDETPKQADRKFVATEHNIKPENDGVTNYNSLDRLINETIGQHSDFVLIYFPAGTYDFSGTINLSASNSNLVFQGAGTNTEFRFQVGKANTCFSINGNTFGTKEKLTSGIWKDAEYIYVINGNNYSKGEWIKYFEFNYPVEDATKWQECIGQITQIAEPPSGNRLYLLEPASKDYSIDYGPYIQKINPVKNIGIENLKITRLDEGKPSNDPWENGSNINFNYAVNCWVKGVELSSTCRHHIIVSNSAHLEISGCYIHDANNIGDGGYGYGVVLQRATCFSLIENNSFRKLRHAMLVQGGANSNVFAYNYSEENIGKTKIIDEFGVEIIIDFEPPDICLHGRYPFANLFEHNSVCEIKADKVHKEGEINNGPFNSFMRNYSRNAALTLYNTPHSNVEGCKLIFGLTKDDETSIDTDLFGKWPKDGYDSYADYPEVTHNDYKGNPNYFDEICDLRDKSYYYIDRPYFLNDNDEFPSIGPAVGSINGPLSNTIPACGRYSTYNTTPTKWPPEPLSITITGPTSLNAGQSATYTAHPSGGSGTYTNYEWWEMKNDDVPMLPAGGNGILAPPSNQWVYLTSGPDKQQITISRTYSFSLKCVVTDSHNDQATSNILSVRVSGGALAKHNAEQAPVMAVPIPKELELSGNIPNPFNPTTTIKFGLPEDGYVQLTIYSMSGQKVRTLLDGQVSKGYHQIVWDGTNESGQPVSGGLYVYELRAGNKRLLKKMLLVK